MWLRFEDCLNIDRPRYIYLKLCMWRRCLYHSILFTWSYIVYFPKYRYFKMLKFISIAVWVTVHHVHFLWTCISRLHQGQGTCRCGLQTSVVFLNTCMLIIKLFSYDLKTILLFYIYSSTKSTFLSGNTTPHCTS